MFGFRIWPEDEAVRAWLGRARSEIFPKIDEDSCGSASRSHGLSASPKLRKGKFYEHGHGKVLQ
jgi:hypothetical protein